MATLSRFHALAPQTVIVPWEIDVALAKLVGVEPPPQPRLFGVGVAHAFHAETLPSLLPTNVSLPLGYRSAVEQGISDMLERAVLYGSHSHMSEEWHKMLRGNVFGNKFADYENDLAARAIQEKFNRGNKLERVVMATELWNIAAPLSEGLARAGISHEDFFGLTRAEVTDFMLSMPSRRVTYALRLARHRNTQKPFEENDLNDVLALAVAVPYCNVAVTEKTWIHAMRQAKLDTEYDTLLIDNVRDLTAILIRQT